MPGNNNTNEYNPILNDMKNELSDPGNQTNNPKQTTTNESTNNKDTTTNPTTNNTNINSGKNQNNEDLNFNLTGGPIDNLSHNNNNYEDVNFQKRNDGQSRRGRGSYNGGYNKNSAHFQQNYDNGKSFGNNRRIPTISSQRSDAGGYSERGRGRYNNNNNSNLFWKTERISFLKLQIAFFFNLKSKHFLF